MSYRIVGIDDVGFTRPQAFAILSFVSKLELGFLAIALAFALVLAVAVASTS